MRRSALQVTSRQRRFVIAETGEAASPGDPARRPARRAEIISLNVGAPLQMPNLLLVASLRRSLPISGARPAGFYRDDAGAWGGAFWDRRSRSH
jgi:hypothetical protein